MADTDETLAAVYDRVGLIGVSWIALAPTPLLLRNPKILTKAKVIKITAKGKRKMNPKF